MSNRLRVLVSAYACSPYKGSEPAVGWGFVSALAKHHDLWVIVEEEKFRKDIEHYLQENPDLGDTVQFFFIEKKRNRTLRKILPPSYYRYYRQWHVEAMKLARELNSQVKFDIAHQLTMVGFREPGYLWKLGIPFVWGPVGGMGLFPWRFLGVVGLYGACYYAAYNAYNLAQMRFMRRPKEAAVAAGEGLFLATPENAKGAYEYWSVAGTVIPETGLPGGLSATINKRNEQEPLQIIWTGLHEPRKALNLGLEALAALDSAVGWQLQVLGEGQCTGEWKRLAAKLGISDRCNFHGWLRRDEALSIMNQGHLLLITSLRDLTSTVTIEALALGLPIVCLDHCGFSEVVNESCGIKIPVTSPREVVSRISNALTFLHHNEDQRQLLANGALARSKDFSWEQKARSVDQIYREKVEHFSLNGSEVD